MGASYSSRTLSETLAGCDQDILHYVLGQSGAHVKDIFLRFVDIEEQVKVASSKNDKPHPVMENASQFAHIFTATNNDHGHWMKLFTALDDRKVSTVDFYEAIATVVRLVVGLFGTVGRLQHF
jgi:hypothetical protein